eukprot:267799_1
MSLAIREVECIDREVKRCLNEIESEIQKMEQDHSPSEASKLSRKIEHTKSRIKTMEIELQTVESRETARKFKPVIRDHRSKVKEFEQMLLWIPKYKPISLNTHNISVKINQRYAKTIYSFNFENMNDINYGSSELMFEITIGVNAFISGFMANIDGEIFDGKTKEKQEANKEYMSAKTKDENAILISQPYDNISNVFLIKTNIDGQSNILLEITIEEYLAKKFDFNELNIENGQKIINQMFNLIHLIYFRYNIYTLIACIFGNGPSDDDKLNLPANHFKNKRKIINLLNQSTKEIIKPFKFLIKPKIENRIILTLFYHHKQSHVMIKCLKYFDSTFKFNDVNPENELTLNSYFRLFCKKWPNEEYCVGSGMYNQRQILSTVCKTAFNVDFKIGHFSLKKTIDSVNNINSFGKYQLYLTLKPMSNEKKIFRICYTEPTFYKYKPMECISIDNYKKKGCDEFIVIKIFENNDTDSFYYIVPSSKLNLYIYMRINGVLSSYDGAKYLPTIQGKWGWFPQLKQESYISNITIINKLNENIKKVEIFYANGDKGKQIDIHEKQNIIKSTYQKLNIGDISVNNKCIIKGFKGLYLYPSYWDIIFVKGNCRYKLNKNNAKFNILERDNNTDITLSLCQNSRGIWCNFVFKSHKTYFYCTPFMKVKV